MNASPKRTIIMHGIKCLLSVLTFIIGIAFFTKYISQIMGYIGNAIAIGFGYIVQFFTLALPASPSITGVFIAISLWLVCLNEKLENENLLSLKFNLQSKWMNFASLFLSFLFFISFIVQSTSGFTALKLALLLGVGAQVMAIVEFSCIKDRIIKAKKETLPLDF